MVTRITLNPGAVFAGYTILQIIGEGSTSTVYLAKHPQLPRNVALKIMYRDLVGDEIAARRFKKEAGYLVRLRHPNIVAIGDYGADDGHLWIATEYVDAIDAAKAVGSGPFEPAYAVHVITETARALDHAKTCGFLHGDVKPANILLERSFRHFHGRILLADFGIAAISATAGDVPDMENLVLAARYAPLEKYDVTDPDGRSDEYSLGCTLFHLLTGQLPYAGDTFPRLLNSHANDEIPRPSEIRPGLPAALDAVVMRAMAKHPEDRYASSGEFAAAAQRALLDRA